MKRCTWLMRSKTGNVLSHVVFPFLLFRPYIIFLSFVRQFHMWHPCSFTDYDNILTNVGLVTVEYHCLPSALSLLQPSIKDLLSSLYLWIVLYFSLCCNLINCSKKVVLYGMHACILNKELLFCLHFCIKCYTWFCEVRCCLKNLHFKCVFCL